MDWSMDRKARFILFGISAILYAVAIFVLSSMPKVPLPPQYYDIPSPDKLAHTALYFGLGILLYLAFTNSSDTRISARAIQLSLIVGIAYGLMDEVHQGFVPGRTSSLIDVGFNALGIGISQLVIVLLRNRKAKQEGAKAESQHRGNVY
jgi:VanZ family protein